MRRQVTKFIIFLLNRWLRWLMMCDEKRIKDELERLEEALNAVGNAIVEGNDDKAMKNLEYSYGIINYLKELLPY